MNVKNWRIEYDPELDSLYCGVQVQPKDARMFTIEQGFNYYITKKGEITGIYIEYFKTIAKDWLKKIPKDYFKE